MMNFSMPSRRDAKPRSEISQESLHIMGIPKEYWEAVITDYVGKNQDILQRYVANIHDMYDDCINLFFAGSNGSGKSFVASIILKEAYIRRYSARKIDYVDYISRVFSGDKEYAYLIKNKIDFLCIDELGKETNLNSDAEKNLLIDLLKEREELGLPTIICTNITAQELEARYGRTLFSTLNNYFKLKFDGEDRRRSLFNERKGMKILRGDNE